MAGEKSSSARRHLSVVLYYGLFMLVASQVEYSITFTEEPSSQVLASGEVLTIRCTVSSSPLTPSTARWFRNGNEVVTSSSVTTSLLGSTAVLSITSFSSTHSGEYWCVVEFGSLGSLRSSLATIELASTESIQGFDTATKTVMEFGSLVLSCPQPTSSPPANISWLVSGSPISLPSNSRIGVTLGGHLVFSSIDNADTGISYSCQATNPKDPSIVRTSPSVVVQLSPSALPSFQGQQFVPEASGGTKTAVEGSTVEMECFTTGAPPSLTTWYKDNSEVTTSGRVTLRQNNRILRLSDTQAADAGEYVCNTMQVGFINENANSTVTLEVIVPPTISNGFTNQSVLVESDLTLTCEASGTSPLMWSWRRGSSLMTVGVVNTGNRTQLSLSNVQTSDADIYQCIATHATAGSASLGAVVVVEVVAPEIVNITSKDIAVFVGSSVSLFCLATGGPRPSYNWYAQQQDRRLTNEGRVTVSGGDLLISNAQTSDSGGYYCNASNTAGSVRSQTILVRVLEPLSVVHSPEKSVVVEVNRNTTLSCRLQGSVGLSISYKWLFNGKPLNTISNSRFVLGSGSGNLTITGAEEADSGVYMCIGVISVEGSTADSLEQEVNRSTVVVATEPSMPLGVAVTTTTSSSAALSWQEPANDGGAAITLYWVEVFVQSQFGPNSGNMADPTSLWRRVNQSTSVMSFNVTGLLPYTGYQFRVLAENGAGIGPRSQPSAPAVTMEAAPNAPPVNISVTRLSVLTSFNISWQPPPIRLSNGKGRNGIVTGYKISYKPSGESVTIETGTITGGTTYELSGLRLNFVYELSVKALTGGGEGVYSEPELVSTAEFDPTSPRNVQIESIRNSSNQCGASINITWDSPTIDSNFKDAVYIIDYVVLVTSGSQKEREIRSIGNSTAVKVDNLDWGNVYTVFVYGNFSTLVNVGPPGSSTPETLPNGPPSPVSGVAVTSGADHSLLLVWTLPSDGGVTLVQVNIEGLATANNSWILVASLSPPTDRFTLHNAYPLLYSHFRLEACNTLGCSCRTERYPAPPAATPSETLFYETVWFIAVVSVVGVILVAIVIIAIIVCCKLCCSRSGKKDVYMLSDQASSVGSVFSVRPKPLYTIESRERENHIFGSNTLDSNFVSNSSPQMTHLEFGPPPAHAYSGSNVSSNTLPSAHSQATLQTQSTHSLLQAKYSRAQHHWLNEGFSQDTPEHQRRREFIRGIDEMDSGSIIAESVASTYV